MPYNTYPKPPERDVDLLRLTAKWCERENGYDQETWGRYLGEAPFEALDYTEDAWFDPEKREWIPFLQTGQVAPLCGVQACVAGNALLASGAYEMRKEDDSGLWFYEKFSGERVNSVGDVAGRLLGLTDDEAAMLFEQYWRPREDLDVAGALEELAQGESIEHVSEYQGCSCCRDNDDDYDEDDDY